MKEEMQKLMYQMQMIQQEIQRLQEQAQSIQAKLIDLQSLKIALTDMQKVKQVGAWTSLGMGTYTKCKLSDTSETLVSVGAGTFVKKSIPDATATIETQIKLTEKFLEQMEQNIYSLVLQAQLIEKKAGEIGE